MPTLGFLHTADVHVATFDALVAEAAPDARTVHAVDPGLLAEARAEGVGPAVRDRLAVGLRDLAADADVVVCTCSTLSGAAEALAARIPRPVLRVDRPMAEAAARIGGRVVVVAALESTLEPTRALLAECVAERAEIVLAPCPWAWPLFEAGDDEAYRAVVAAHVREVAADADVVVLAQASMAPVAARADDGSPPVLSSPRLAVDRALALASGAVAPPAARGRTRAV